MNPTDHLGSTPESTWAPTPSQVSAGAPPTPSILANGLSPTPSIELAEPSPPQPPVSTGPPAS